MPTVTDDGHPYCKKEKDLIFSAYSNKIKLRTSNRPQPQFTVIQRCLESNGKRDKNYDEQDEEDEQNEKAEKTVKKTEKRRERGNEGERKKKR